MTHREGAARNLVQPRTLVLLATLGLLAVAAPVAAQPFEISWWTVDSGGLSRAIAGPYELSTTAGQPDAGGPFPGGAFVVHSGFWALVAGGAGGPQADLSATITDGQATAVPGTPVTYTMTVSNAGPNSVSNVWVFNDTAILLNVAWTCAASPGSSCPASGTGGSPNHFVNLAIGGTVTYTLNGLFQTSSIGTYANTITATVPSGVTDPNPANNSATDSDLLTTQADLDLETVDGPDPVAPGQPYTYIMTVTNQGPSYSFGSTLTDTLPAGVTYTGSFTGVSSCVHVSGTVTCDLGPIDVGEQHTVRIQATLLPATTGPLSNVATILGDDVDPVVPNNVDVETTTVGIRVRGEVVHGTRLTTDLASVNMGPDPHFYRMFQAARSSYEIVVDGTSGDIGGSTGVGLDRLANDGTTVVANSFPIGSGPSRSLRWMNTSSTPIDDEYVRVRSTDCQIFCGPDDHYRLRAWDTTGSIPRFNNSGSQVTVVLLQNTNTNAVFARVYFWSTSGTLLLDLGVFLQGRGLFSTTTNFPELVGVGGSITVASDAPYGTLVGKAVALEPSTGFSFDSPMTLRPR